MSMSAVNTSALITDHRWLTPSVISVKFDPARKFDYEPGQFLSLWVPHSAGHRGYLKRAYTFANPCEIARKEGYEFCIKINEGGVASEYVKTLKIGDEIRFSGPYGDFVYEIPKPGRVPCFISTSTGLSPFRATLMSEQYREQTEHTGESINLFGVRSQAEIIFPDFLKDCGAKSVIALSRPEPGWSGFQGRVTDYLRQLPPDWVWHIGEFYLCGNGPMIQEVRRILTGGHGVSEQAIHLESFSD